MARYIIIGGVAGGMSAAARLRRLDEQAEIIIFERGDYVSYANCGLPYYIGGVITDRNKLMVQTPESLKARLNLDVRVNTAVISIDRQAKTVLAQNAAGESIIEAYDKLILAPGAEPIRPPLPGVDHPLVFTVRSIPDIDRIKTQLPKIQPKSVMIVGGGFIGLEMADNLWKAGMQVHLAEMAPHVLPSMLDPDMAALVHGHLRAKGISLHLGTPVKQFAPCNSGLTAELGNGMRLEVGMAILAIGVRPDNALAKAAGLEIGACGGIIVNQYLQTSDPNIYAVGDAIEVCNLVTNSSSVIPLAGPANKQGRMAADNITGLKRSYRGTQGTAIVDVLGLHIAGTGVTAAMLKKQGNSPGVSITHSFPHATYYPGGSMMAIKLIFAPDNGKLLGAQIVGYEGVDKRIDVLATTMRYSGTVRHLQELELAYAPAFSSAKDPVNIAGFAATNILDGHLRTIQTADVAELLNKATFVDVRDAADHLASSIPGSINIPLPQLRNRMNEIPRDKPVVVYCRVGHQAYIAARILMQNGYADVTNLAGGWRTYSAVSADQQASLAQVEYTTPPQHEIAAARLIEETTSSSSPVLPSCRVLDVTGLACPGPIARVHQVLESMPAGATLEVRASDPGFIVDIQAWCSRTGNKLLSMAESGAQSVVKLQKGKERQPSEAGTLQEMPHDKTIVVFSGDLDKALAAFVIATGAVAMNRKVTLFFTFWGLNVLRRSQHVSVKKGFIDHLFGIMMPRGSKKLGLSRMNMGGIGPRLIRSIMGGKGIASPEELLKQAIDSGVRIVACQMSMDVMGIKKEELLPGVEIGGVATYLATAENADTNLFI